MATARTERFTARQDLLQAPVNFGNSIGGKNSTDLMTFSLGKRSNVVIALTGLKADADLSLATNRGTFSSRKRGRQNENLALTLEAGTYTVRVFKGRADAKTRYRLSLQATATNTAPSLTANALLNANRSSPSVINASFLKSIDAEQSAGQITYRLTRLPTSGSLLFNNAPLVLNSTFTQADIDSGRISYRNQSIKEVPNSSNSLGYSVRTSGNNAAWISGSDNSAEVYFYNGATGQTKRLTTNSVRDDDLQISGNNAAWISGTGATAEVYFYNGTTDTTTRVTSDATEDKFLSLTGELLAWVTRYSSETDVRYSINGGTATAINSDTSYSDSSPVTSSSHISFKRVVNSDPNSSDRGVYLFNASTRASAIKLPFSSYGDTYQNTMFGSKVAWTVIPPGNSGQRDVYFYDGSTTLSIDNSTIFDDRLTTISDTGAISFSRGSLSAGEQLFWTAAISNSPKLVGSNVSSLPQASGAYLTWDARFGSDGNVEYYNGSTTYSIDNGTRYNDERSRISGSNIVFRRDDTLGTADDGWYLFNLETVQTRRITSDITNLAVVGMNGKNVFLHNSTNSRLLFYDGTTTTDSFGFTVSDGSISTSGTFNIGLDG